MQAGCNLEKDELRCGQWTVAVVVQRRSFVSATATCFIVREMEYEA